ncbi:hypothetical protein [Xanthomonas arboricola]|uniref:hypothetical protein n=1 Tax=Xanthomonas arboricola TaxID=56448 RepID=UPI0012900A2D|nr:hypothetical protein [Xanthomonas arboricola]
MKITKLDKMVKESFGLRLSALFSSVGGNYPELNFSQQKESFFEAVEMLLKEGKIIFIAPGVDCYVSPDNKNPEFSIENTGAHWKDSSEKIISYLRERWPKDAVDENDDDLNMYFYEIPSVIWVDESGKYFAS